MKILYFTLGSPSARFYGKKKYGFDEFLKQDIIFYGPSDDTTFTYNGKSFPIIQLFEETSVFKVLNQLPAGWIPDIVTCETVVLNYLPDFYKCPYKTLCFTRDSWGDVLYNPYILKLFDVVYYQTVDIENVRLNFKANLLPTIGSPISVPHNINKINYKDRRIDILAIANYNSGFYHERYKLFSLVSNKLGKQYNIKFLVGVPYDEIHSYYQNSKIVLDWSYVMSNRSFEATINGCLLFSNANNPLIKEVWKPEEEYVPYDFTNVITLLKEYLEDSTKSLEFISKAQKKLKTLPSNPGSVFMKRIKTALKDKSSPEYRIKGIENQDKTLLYYCLSTPLYFSYNYSNHNHPVNWRKLYFERISLALDHKPDNDLKIKELIEVVRMAFLLKKEKLFFNYAFKLEETMPEYAWTYYLKARVYLDRKSTRLNSSHIPLSRMPSSA